MSPADRPAAPEHPVRRPPADVAAAERVLRIAADGGLPVLDRLADLARSLTGSGSAQLSLLTHTQTVAGGAGLPEQARRGTTPLSESLCTVTATCGAALSIEDARADPRVAALPPVATGVVGAYLGVPLVTAAGRTIGALCVFDPGPRAWAADAPAVLEQLARWAASELELAALSEEHERAGERWQLATSAAGIASFVFDLRSGELDSDARLRELYGYPPDATLQMADVERRIDPDDLPRVRRAASAAIASGTPYDAEYRVLLPDGHVRWIRARGSVVTDDAGRPRRLLGSVLDTTDTRDADARANRVLETMPAAFVALDRDWRVTYVNTEAEARLGVSRDELLGAVFWDAFPLTRGTEVEHAYRLAASSGELQTFEAYYPAPLDAWYEVRAWPTSEGLSVFFADVSARHDAQQLVELSAAVGDRLTRVLDVDDSLRELAQVLVPGLADWTIVTVIDEDGGIRDVATWHVDPARRPLLEAYAACRLDGREDTSVAEAVARTQEPEIIAEGALDIARRVLRSPAALAAITELDPGPVVSLPLPAGGRSLGALTLFRAQGRPPLSERELRVATAVAQRAGMALENARLYTEARAATVQLNEANARLRQVADHNRSVSLALQEAMLTRLPEPDHLTMTSRYLTAGGNVKVGGDWYDAIVVPDGATIVSLGDVVGHDVHAAGVMGQLRSMLRMVAWDREEPPSEIVARLDRAMAALGIETMATLVMLRIEQSAEDRAAGLRTLRWTNAGHPAPILLHADGTTTVLEAPPGVLLGFLPDIPRYDHTATAPPDSILVLYSDGLVETRTRGVDEGQEELLASLRRHHELPPEELVDRIIADLVGDGPSDDVAVLLVRFGREPPV